MRFHNSSQQQIYTQKKNKKNKKTGGMKIKNEHN